MHILFIRGLPGSGKSTLAKEYANHVHCEADEFFMSDVKYVFDMSMIGMAHNYCFRKFANAVLEGKDVVVSNTFVKCREFKRYKDFLIEHGMMKYVNIVTLTNEYGSIHEVPEETMERMYNNFAGHEAVLTYLSNK